MKERSLFGVGFERKTYEDPNHPKRLIKESIESITESVATIKGRFYLTKILHRLFPTHIPDIHRATSTKPQSITVEKKELDAKHKELQKLEMGFHDSSLNTDERFRLLQGEYLYGDEPTFKRLRLVLSTVGVKLDKFGLNFGFDPQGEAVYVDSFRPWWEAAVSQNGVKRLVRGYNPVALQAHIQSLPEGQKTAAERDFHRLETLFLEAEREIQST